MTLEEELKIKLQYHSKLNPKIWINENKLRTEVKTKLLQFAKAFQSFANIPQAAIEDIILTGGNANYNYTKYSDLDVHIMVDKAKVTGFGLRLDDAMQDKKMLWTLTHNIKVLGYPIEPYAQDVHSKFPTGQGVYSLKSDKWIQKPVFQKNLDFKNDPRLKNKVESYMKMIDDMIKHKMGKTAFDALKTKLKNMRNSAIAAGGEFSFENLVFKELRNQGYLDKMNAYSTNIQDKSLSL